MYASNCIEFIVVANVNVQFYYNISMHSKPSGMILEISKISTNKPKQMNKKMKNAKDKKV